MEPMVNGEKNIAMTTSSPKLMVTQFSEDESEDIKVSEKKKKKTRDSYTCQYKASIITYEVFRREKTGSKSFLCRFCSR